MLSPSGTTSQRKLNSTLKNVMWTAGSSSAQRYPALGRNGVGKSTLIRMISGAEYPDRGRIKRNVRISFPLGLVGFKGTLTGRENCRFVARIYGLDRRAVERFV